MTAGAHMPGATFQAAADGLAGVGGAEGPVGDGEGGAAAGPHAAGTIVFMGLGEPLLHPRFLDMVRLAKARGLRAEVTTNALLLDDEVAGRLLAAGLDQLVVSIDGVSGGDLGAARLRRLPRARASYARPSRSSPKRAMHSLESSAGVYECACVP